MMNIKKSLFLLFAVFSGSVNGSGQEEDVLVQTVGTVYQGDTRKTRYYCTYRNLWTKERQPKKYPESQARWNGPVMWDHTSQFTPWHAGYLVTRGVEKVVEEGFTDMIVQEFQSQGEQVHSWVVNPNGGFYTSQKDFIHMPPIDVNVNYPYLSTLVGMSPSPDWFTGFYTYWLIDEYAKTWYNHLKIQSKPWKAGTDAGTTYTATNSDLEPQLPAERFVPRNAPANGELLSPDGSTVPTVAEWECFLWVGDEDLILPDCDWFMDPCCNSTPGCDQKLPYNETPSLSDEYRQVLSNSKGGGSSAVTVKLSLVACVVGFVVQWMMMV